MESGSSSCGDNSGGGSNSGGDIEGNLCSDLLNKYIGFDVNSCGMSKEYIKYCLSDDGDSCIVVSCSVPVSFDTVRVYAIC